MKKCLLLGIIHLYFVSELHLQGLKISNNHRSISQMQIKCDSQPLVMVWKLTVVAALSHGVQITVSATTATAGHNILTMGAAMMNMMTKNILQCEREKR